MIAHLTSACRNPIPKVAHLGVWCNRLGLKLKPRRGSDAHPWENMALEFRFSKADSHTKLALQSLSCKPVKRLGDLEYCAQTHGNADAFSDDGVARPAVY